MFEVKFEKKKLFWDWIFGTILLLSCWNYFFMFILSFESLTDSTVLDLLLLAENVRDFPNSD
jgi:hypothetical protein